MPLALVKIGGGFAAMPGVLERVAAAVARAARQRPLVVIPGGGPFADQVRAFDREHRISADAAHWMAILAMDQYAFALADLIPSARVVDDWAGIQTAHAAGEIPVLAPFRWLRAADELPHSWDVTSDSLSAYLATLLGAEQLVLIKPVSGQGELVDPWFGRTVPAGLDWQVLGAGEAERLEAVLSRGNSAK
jgi:5-(aminomethyl)-3-furanmethanol phosphate kinase